MVTFVSYACLSSALTALSVVYAVLTRHQFYPSLLFLTTHKLNIVIVGNLSFFLLLLLGRLLKSVFLGSLSRDEIEELVQNSKYAITETCLALTIFREELNVRVLGLFTLLLFVKIFHWLAVLRVEHIARTHGLPLLVHVRLAALLGFLLALDCGCLYLLSAHLLQVREASVLLLFAFEWTILTVSLVSTACKYLLFLVDQRLEGRWQSRSVCLFYLELASDLLRLLLYLCFFLLVCTYYGLPLHLIRELCITFYTLRERIVKFIAYRRITQDMQSRFPDASREELQAGDSTCIICREDMEQAKRLQCGHCFHLLCLRSWLERSSSCPTCRAGIAAPQQPQPSEQQQPQQQPAAGAFPPLPPHLQAHVDALNERRGAATAAAGAGREDGSRTAANGAIAAPASVSAATVSSPSASAPAGISAASPEAMAQLLHGLYASAQPAAARLPSASLPPAASERKDDHREGATAAAAGATAAVFHPALPMAGGLLFPPPAASHPPHPALHPAAFFPGFHAPPLSAAGAVSPGVLEAASLLPLLSHHTQLLTLHMEMLESELRQLRIIWERQLQLQESCLHALQHTGEQR